MPSIFPNGIDAVVKKTGWPIEAHNRWWYVVFLSLYILLSSKVSLLITVLQILIYQAIPSQSMYFLCFAMCVLFPWLFPSTFSWTTSVLKATVKIIAANSSLVAILSICIDLTAGNCTADRGSLAMQIMHICGLVCTRTSGSAINLRAHIHAWDTFRGQ